jgi:hypothetical protein
VVTTECSGWPTSITAFSVSVAVGQACTQAPQETHLFGQPAIINNVLSPDVHCGEPLGVVDGTLWHQGAIGRDNPPIRKPETANKPGDTHLLEDRRRGPVQAYLSVSNRP